MRILIATGIFPPEIGGPASYAVKLAKQISQKHQVAVITYSPVFSYAGDKELGFPVTRVFNRLPIMIKQAVYLFRLWRLAKDYDIIYAINAVSAGLLASWVARMRKKKLYVKVVGDVAWERAMNQGKTFHLINDFQKEPKHGYIRRLHRMQVQVCRSAQKVIVPSAYLAGLVRGWGLRADQVAVVYNGVDFKASKLSKEEARKEIGVSGNLILSVGRLVPWKGFRMLIKIMPQLLQINQFFRLVIVGDGPDMHQLQAMVRNLGLERKVYFAGGKNQQELAVYFAAADMFVLNTGYEGFSHQILEAMSAGVPVITTPVGGNREVIAPSENGFMVRYNDEFNLVEAIKSLWNMPDVREKFIEEGKKTAAEYTVSKMFKETMAVLQGEEVKLKENNATKSEQLIDD